MSMTTRPDECSQTHFNCGGQDSLDMLDGMLSVYEVVFQVKGVVIVESKSSSVTAVNTERRQVQQQSQLTVGTISAAR